jgi:HlyD family secretion protein
VTGKPDKLLDNTQQSIRRHLMIGGTAAIIVTAGIGGLSATAELSGAVIASGYLVVESNIKKVQHPTGGVVAELKVRDGMRVKEGELLIRLDETIANANLAIVRKGIDELSARQARLEAERDDNPAVHFPAELARRVADLEVVRIVHGERQLFELRKTARAGQRAQLGERIAQLNNEIDGLTAQAGAKSKEVELVGVELEAIRTLWSRNLIPISRMTAMEREATRLQGEHAQLLAAVAQAKGRVVETQLQIIQLDQDLRSEVARELRDIQAKIAELQERRIAAEDHLRRVEIRAPQGGTVHQMQVHTVGGVVSPGEPVMLIVPSADTLLVEVRVSPQDVDLIQIGQDAMVRFSAFNMGTTPELNGKVVHASADLIVDQRTGLNYFLVRITLSKEELERLGDLKLAPGMPVESFIRTQSRTILSYLTKPLRDQATRAMRER